MDSKISLWCKCGWWSSTLTLSQSIGWWAPQACSARAEVAACHDSTVLTQPLVKASAGLTNIGGSQGSQHMGPGTPHQRVPSIRMSAPSHTGFS